MTPQDTMRMAFEQHWIKVRGPKKARHELARREDQPECYVQDSANRHWITWQAALAQQGEQQPVAWANMKDDGTAALLSISQHPEDRANWANPVPLYAGAAPAAQPIIQNYLEKDKTQPLEYWNAVEGWVTIKPDARTLQKLRQEAYKRTDMIYRDDPDTMFALGFDAGFAAHGIGVQK